MRTSNQREQLALVVHEVRSPTAALAAMVGVGTSGVDDASLRTLVELSLAACRSIERILTDADLGSLRLEVVDVDQVGEDALLVHDAHDEDPSTAFALSRLSHPETLNNTPIGIFRDVVRGTYDSAMRAQIDTAIAALAQTGQRLGLGLVTVGLAAAES